MAPAIGLSVVALRREFAFDRALLYATGGVAVADVMTRRVFIPATDASGRAMRRPRYSRR
jgi:hypothetical protein